MGTIIERVEISEAGWRNRHSALRLAVAAAKRCLHRAGCDPDSIDLLINAGIYRDRNLGEPALAALIQEMIGANLHDPHTGEHGTFSFDVANGECGVLTALQIVDGFLRAGIIKAALIVASDANPGFGMSKHFPYSPVGSALLCRWNDGDDGLGPVRWSARTDGEGFCARVGFRDGRNVLRFQESAAFDVDLAGVCALAASSCLAESSLTLSDVAICVAPARQRFRAALAAKLGVPPAHLVVAAIRERTPRPYPRPCAAGTAEVVIAVRWTLALFCWSPELRVPSQARHSTAPRLRSGQTDRSTQRSTSKTSASDRRGVTGGTSSTGGAEPILMST